MGSIKKILQKQQQNGETTVVRIFSYRRAHYLLKFEEKSQAKFQLKGIHF
jgi:hypothetical protein